jgi:hypothetical protein
LSYAVAPSKIKVDDLNIEKFREAWRIFVSLFYYGINKRALVDFTETHRDR